MSFKKDLRLLVKPYYLINILLSVSYVAAKKLPVICEVMFEPSDSQCELDSRESEILFFLLIVVMIRTRKTGSVTMINYMTSSFMYCKVANLLLWFYADVRMGVLYGILFVLCGIFLPEPTYKGPENVTYFRTATSLEEELSRDRRITWLIEFYTVWNPSCNNFAPVFSEVSHEYHLENLRFGKIDIGRYPDAAAKYSISDASTSQQLPTVILFKDGKEFERRPFRDRNNKVVKFYFTQDNFKAAFDLNNLYADCKANPLKKKKTITENVSNSSESHLKSE